MGNYYKPHPNTQAILDYVKQNRVFINLTRRKYWIEYEPFIKYLTAREGECEHGNKFPCFECGMRAKGKILTAQEDECICNLDPNDTCPVKIFNEDCPIHGFSEYTAQEGDKLTPGQLCEIWISAGLMDCDEFVKHYANTAQEGEHHSQCPKCGYDGKMYDPTPPKEECECGGSGYCIPCGRIHSKEEDE